MTEPVRLTATEHDPAYPCSDPALYQSDEQLLAYMLQDLRALMRRLHAGDIDLQPYESLTWSVHGLERRTVICDPVGLAAHADVHIVGFFGERRGDPATQSRINRLERALLTEFRTHPGVLSYSSIELVDVSATLEFESPAAAGDKLSVTWSGPGNRQDFISIDPAGAEESVV